MNASVLHCKDVLTDAGWRKDINLHLDPLGIITRIESGSAVPGSTLLEGPVITGMPNLHSHAFQRQMAGLTGRRSSRADSFWSWREQMYALANRIDPDQMRQIAAWLQVEMLEAGFTACAEFHYIHNDINGRPYADVAEMSHSLVGAAEISGISMLLLPVLYCRSGFDASGPAEEQRRFYHTPDGYLNLLHSCNKMVENTPLCNVGAAPHSLRAVSEDQLTTVLSALNSLVNDPMPVHIHIAEQLAEVEQCLEATGQRPLDWLMERVHIDAHWCLIHATHMSARELKLATSSGAVAGLCPTTEADLGDGIFDAQAWIERGGDFGIGSDSNIRVSVTEELRMLEYTNRLATGRRNVVARDRLSCGRALYERAALGGAMALGQPIGSIAIDHRADLIELDRDHPLLQGREGDDLIDTLVFAGGKDMVRSVFVAGHQLVAAGRHHRRNDVVQGFRAAMQGLQLASSD